MLKYDDIKLRLPASGKYKIPLSDCARAAGGVSARAIPKHFVCFSAFVSVLAVPALFSFCDVSVYCCGCFFRVLIITEHRTLELVKQFVTVFGDLTTEVLEGVSAPC